MYALLILLALQSATAMTGPDDVKSPNSLTVDGGPSLGGACRVSVEGKLLYPAYLTSIPFIEVDIYNALNLSNPVAKLNTDSFGQFRVLLPPTKIGLLEYVAVVNAEGMTPLRQRFFLPRDCLPDAGDQLEFVLHPAAKPAALVAEEDTVAIESLRAKPNNYDRDLTAGRDYEKKDDRENAVRTFAQALQINSASVPARVALGQYAFDAGQFQLAAELFGQAIRLGSMSSEVYYLLGVSNYKLGRLDIAEHSLVRALEIDPNIGKAYLQLYNVYMKAKMPDKALQAAETYLQKYPGAGDREYVQSMADKLRKSLRP